MKNNIKILVSFSGGKDSVASLLWAIHESGFKKENISAVFCDTGWEHPATLGYIKEICQTLAVPLVKLHSKKYKGFEDLCIRKRRVPSIKAKFCTEQLKVIPMIDFILDDCDTDVIVIQGIRKDESKTRALMQKQCTYFKYYFQPYRIDDDGRERFHTYRKKDVFSFCKKYLNDVLRPVFDLSGAECLTFILAYDFKPHPFYYKGIGRIGCWPCINCAIDQVKPHLEIDRLFLERVSSLEAKLGRTFFAPGFIPSRYSHDHVPETGKSIPKINEVVRYACDRKATLDLFSDDESLSGNNCMSVYVICE